MIRILKNNFYSYTSSLFDGRFVNISAIIILRKVPENLETKLQLSTNERSENDGRRREVKTKMK